MLGSPRVYVINDPHLIAAVQRQPKVLTFQAISDNFAHLVCDLTPAALEIQKSETSKWLHDPKAVESPSGTIYKALSPTKSLDEMNRTMVNALQRGAHNWVPSGKESTTTALYSWVRRVVTVAGTEAIYGPMNPYGSAAMRKHFWTYNAGLGRLSMGNSGSFFARDIKKSRAFLAERFIQYFSQGHHLEASGLTRQRFDWYTSRGFSLCDCANFEVGNGIAILSNTVPAAFWHILHIFSDPTVLAACRAEVLQQAVDTKDPEGIVRTLDITALKKSCPALQSAFKEAMRVHSTAVGMRGVVQDHILDGKYLLKRGMMVWMPATVQHFDRERWGADAAEYHHDRFTDRTRPRVNNIFFRAFGGGATLCPGRHFAMNEILTLTAMLLLRFELQPTSGAWVIPTTVNTGMTQLMAGPDFDVEVNIRRKSDDEGVKWAWKLSESDHETFAGSDEDRLDELDEKKTGML
ncbi:cytochrome P450 [Massarina eburnea CBS 473.64]|uniref:Cytochrome P450 n=1 Tax=Massarina eburnea CBS 473.64 TaxID=1395130 RepID=A0A6A6S0V3_9PLEO|nr:cytochrome P450 [Massarina eburnea CBS 473.64]